MLRGFGQKSAVAITLIGVLLVSVGVCLLPAQHPTHSCCSHMSMPCDALNASCCAASPHVPLASVTPVFRGLTSMAVAQAYLPSHHSSMPRVVAIAPVAPSQSPPPGLLSLRI